MKKMKTKLSCPEIKSNGLVTDVPKILSYDNSFSPFFFLGESLMLASSFHSF